MSPPLRIALFCASAVAFGIFFLRAASGMPPFGHYEGPYGDIINGEVIQDRHTPQSVSAITFDYRGFDTMGEEFIFLAAVTGVLALMRTQSTEREKKPKDEASDRKVPAPSDGIKAVGVGLFPFTFLLGVYIVFHGHLTPGGGFQGGVLCATAFLFIYLSGDYADLEKFTRPELLDRIEGFSAAGYVLLGAAAAFSGAAFLTNLLPLGKEGELLSAGNLPLLNLTVGLEIASGFLLLITAFLKQALIVRGRAVK